MSQKVIFNWSTGKDSALALHKIMQDDSFEIHSLLTSVNEKHQRVSMHGVQVNLLEQQAREIGLPLIKMEIPETPTMEVYEKEMRNKLSVLSNQGVVGSVFGDIFLEDLRKYREEKLAEVKMHGIFPLWKKPTQELIHEFIDLGFKAITTCVSEKYLSEDFVGRYVDKDFLKELPKNVDPCGENGEFHTFVFDGPIFKNLIKFEIGEKVYRKYEPAPKDDTSYDCETDSNIETPYSHGFWYCDLIKK